MSLSANFPAVRPSLNLNFTGTTKLDPRITFTRTTIATYFDSLGVMRTAQAGQARFDYDPVTKAPQGLLIEEQRTNLLLQSQDFDNTTNWAASNTTITANNAISPDGNQNAERIAENTANTNHHVGQIVTLSASTTYTLSIYAKAGTSNFVGLTLRGAFGNYGAVEFNVNTGAVSRTSVLGTGYSVVSSSVTNVGSGWYRCVVTVTTGTSVGAGRFYTFMSNGSASFDSDGMPSYTGTSSTVFVYGAQLEAGAFPTSYIPTVASQLTRNADVATMTGTNFSSWYNQGEGTLFADFSMISLTGSPPAVEVGDNTLNNRMNIEPQPATSLRTWARVNVSNNLQADIGINNTVSLSSPTKAALGYALNNINLAANGVVGTADTSCLVPVVDRMGIGVLNTGSSVFLNGYIRRITYYPERLSNAQLQAFTS